MMVLTALLAFQAGTVPNELDALREKVASLERAARELRACLTLYSLGKANTIFRANDVDENGRHDYWVKDVAGLYSKHEGNPRGVRLIALAVARADNSISPDKYPEIKESASKDGYLFVPLRQLKRRNAVVSYDDGTGRCEAQFGYAAFPSKYGRDGNLSFIVNEGMTIYAKDTRGVPPQAWPEDPVKEGWNAVE